MFTHSRTLGRYLVSSAARRASSMTLYGHYISQPTRAVIWLLNINNVEFNFKKVEPTGGETRTEEYKKKFPTSLIPGLDDDGFYLAEGGAIMQYLCEKNGWEQWWPCSVDAISIQKRAKIAEYLSHHHHSTRLISHKVVRPYIGEVFGGVAAEEGSGPIRTQRTQYAIKNLQHFATVFLKEGPFIHGMQEPTIADLAAYCEVGQLLHLQLLPSLADVPAVEAWAMRMKLIPYHDDVHRACVKMGDIFAKKLH